MSESIGKALVALQATLFARELYGPGHAALMRPAAGAASLLGAALGGADSLDVIVIEHRVVCNGVVVAESAALAERLIPRLHAAGIGSLTLTRGIGPEDVMKAADQLAVEGRACEGSSHIRFGRLIVAGNTETPREARALEAVAPELGEVLDKTAAGAGVDQESLEGVIGAICAAVALGRGAILPLASVRNHDEYTYLHTVNVGVLAAALAEAVGLGPHLVREITSAALLHDIGKQSVPLEILTKNGPLTPDERAVVMRHPVDGAMLLLEAPGVSNIARIVAYEHHMLLDGTGYPKRAHRRSIHLASQIVQLADVYDALRTHRPYRAAMTPAEVEQALMKGAGTSYDPDLVTLFLKSVGGRSPGAAGAAGSEQKKAA